MLLTLNIKRLSPHQVTSVLGLIMQNYLDLIPTVKYRMNPLTTIVIFHGRLMFISLHKKSNVISFNDNGGGDVHQSTDTIREFHLHLSDSNLQNAATTKAHLYTLLAKAFDKK